MRNAYLERYFSYNSVIPVEFVIRLQKEEAMLKSIIYYHAATVHGSFFTCASRHNADGAQKKVLGRNKRARSAVRSVHAQAMYCTPRSLMLDPAVAPSKSSFATPREVSVMGMAANQAHRAMYEVASNQADALVMKVAISAALGFVATFQSVQPTSVTQMGRAGRAACTASI